MSEPAASIINSTSLRSQWLIDIIVNINPPLWFISYNTTVMCVPVLLPLTVLSSSHFPTWQVLNKCVRVRHTFCQWILISCCLFRLIVAGDSLPRDTLVCLLIPILHASFTLIFVSLNQTHSTAIIENENVMWGGGGIKQNQNLIIWDVVCRRH